MPEKLVPEKSHLRFERRPSPIMAEHRPLYKIGQILLILHIASRSGKSSLPRLHLFNWALKSAERREMMLKAAERGTLSVPAWGFDPVLAIAVRYAIAEGLVKEISTGYELTETGELFVREIIKDIDLFFSDRAFLEKVGKKITGAMVDATANGWETT